MTYYRWDTQGEQARRAIAAAPAFFKILLKTKDDPFFLERWILHHQRIVGPGNLVIFDNMSTHPDVLRVYERYRDTVLVLGFQGEYTSLQDVSRCPDLYEALGRSTRFFIFLDTDEFLILIDNDRYYDDESLADFLREQGESDALPATWLLNTERSAVRFRCGKNFDELADGVAFGKPILRPKAGLRGSILHNILVSPVLFSAPFKTNFFVLHLKNLMPAQRIAVNVTKLVAAGFADPGESVESICGRDLEGVTNWSAIRFISEIRALISVADREPPSHPLGAGCLELRDDHTIQYYGETERALVQALIRDPVSSYLKAILRTKHRLEKEGRLMGHVRMDSRR
jgi:hypothetical protein